MICGTVVNRRQNRDSVAEALSLGHCLGSDDDS